MDWSQYGPEAADDPEIVGRCYDEIIGAMQSTLDPLAAAHAHPLMERLRGWIPGPDERGRPAAHRISTG
jgi:hypothetical protein